MSSHYKTLTAQVFLFFAAAAALNATSFDTIYSFGDSLSDAGNLHTALGIPAAPYVDGHFSNGPVWVQDLSASLGLGSVTPSLLLGHDFAYGGAFSGNSPVHTATALTGQIDLTGSSGQISQYQTLHPVADPNALYTIWIGSNDLLAILQSGATPAAAATDVAAVIANIDSAIANLAGEGAKNFLVVTVPDLGKTPGVTSQGALASAAASGLAAEFDTGLIASLTGGPGINISVLDTYSLLDAIIANGSAYGFTNVTDPCVTGAVEYVGGTACSPTVAGQDQYLFWDQLHPTAPGHALIADAALDTLVPEPTTCALISVGLAAFCFSRRRKV